MPENSENIDFKNRIDKYLPSFVVPNIITDALQGSEAAVLADIQDNELSTLKDCYQTGRGLDISLKEHHIYFDEQPDLPTKQGLFQNRYNILHKRATEAGVILDLHAILGGETEIAVLDEKSSGVIIGKSNIDDFYQFLDTKNLIAASGIENTGYSMDDIKQVIPITAFFIIDTEPLKDLTEEGIISNPDLISWTNGQNVVYGVEDENLQGIIDSDGNELFTSDGDALEWE